VKLAQEIDYLIADAVTTTELEQHADPAALRELSGVTSGDPATRLPAHVSVDISRRLLLTLASDPATAPLVEEAWQEVEDDDSLFIEAIVALGLIANLTLFMATTRVKFKIGKLQIEKGAADVEMIKAALRPLSLTQGDRPATGD
jgi:hypothetical protein